MRVRVPVLLLGGVMLCGIADERPPDRDGDGIPDPFDPFPDDVNRPGRALPDTIYAHTSKTLFRVERSGSPQRVGDFDFADGKSRETTDIAIDRWGVLYAVAFNSFHTCHPESGRCETIAPLGASMNGLSAVPPHVLGGEADGLVAVSTEGATYSLTMKGRATPLGSLGAPSSGDLYFRGIRAYASVDLDPEDRLVEFSPGLPDEVGTTTPLPGVTMYGFASCLDATYAFDQSGSIYRTTGDTYAVLTGTSHRWWGAACSGPELRFSPAVNEPEPPKPSPPETSPPKPDDGPPGLSLCAP